MSKTYPETLPSPSFPVQQGIDNPALRDEMENGTVQSRAKYTRLRKSWSLRYPALEATDRDALRAFYDSVKGGSEAFDYTATDEETYLVRFTGYSETIITEKFYEISVTLEEV